MTLELVVIDLSCLVAGLGDTCATVLSSVARRADVDVSDEDARSVLGLPLRRATAALFQTARDIDSQVERSDYVHDLYREDLLERFSRQGSVREVDGCRDALAALRVQRKRVAITTNLPRLVAATILASVDWHDRALVDTVVTCEEVDEPRPRPGMLLEAMARMHCDDASRVAILGDTPAALVEGTLARCGTIVGALYGSHRREELELRPHTHLVERLIDFVGIVRESSATPSRASA